MLQYVCNSRCSGVAFCIKHINAAALSKTWRVLAHFTCQASRGKYCISLRRIIRNKAADVVESALSSLHTGGRRGRPVVLPSPAMQLVVRACRSRGISAAVFFLDSRCVCDQVVVRELSMGCLGSDSATLVVFHRSRFWLNLWNVRARAEFSARRGCLLTTMPSCVLSTVLRGLLRSRQSLRHTCRGTPR